MTAQRLILLATFGSVLILAGAFGFQYIGGLAPCQLCLWQRWPHAAAIVIGAAGLGLGRSVVLRALAFLGAAATLTTAAIAGFHVGVEQKWWEGLKSCTAGSIEGISASDLLNPNIIIAPPVRCDEIAWQMLGISMAGWNMLISLGLTVLWLMAARKLARAALPRA